VWVAHFPVVAFLYYGCGMSLSADELRLNEPMDWLGLFSFFTFSVFLTGFFYFFIAVDLYKVF
jgi:hypothetical protein